MPRRTRTRSWLDWTDGPLPSRWCRRGGREEVDGKSKSSDLFVALLRELVRRYRPHGTIHLVVDNSIIHKSKKTRAALKALKGKVTLCFLAPYSPKGNPPERVWLDFHTAGTGNHRCPDIDSLLTQVNGYIKAYHRVDHVLDVTYPQSAATHRGTHRAASWHGHTRKRRPARTSFQFPFFGRPVSLLAPMVRTIRCPLYVPWSP